MRDGRGFWQDAVVMVVGASSGIGQAVAGRLGALGARVIAVARDTHRLHDTVRSLRDQGLTVSALPLDATVADAWARAARRVKQEYGRLDVLVYSAGVLHLAPVAHMDVGEARAAMDTNYWGAVLAVQHLVPLLIRGRTPRIGFLSSLSVPCTPPFFTSYAAPKYALHALARCLQQELRPAGVRVSLILPGPVDTPLVAGKLHGELYRLPPGIPVITAEQAAKGVIHAIEHGKPWAVVPRSLRWAARLAEWRPGWMERLYRMTIPDWEASLERHLPSAPAAGQERVPTTSEPAE
jgi:NAD(P)-dependent dehydrogenase (short-subunit alcohol dehydrogenase family)